LRASAEAGLPAIQVSANRKIVATASTDAGARRFWKWEQLAVIARSAGPRFAAGGLLISLELEASYAEVAKRMWRGPSSKN